MRSISADTGAAGRGADCVALRNGLCYAVVNDDAGPAVAAAGRDHAGVRLCIALRGELLLHGACHRVAVQPGTLQLIGFNITEGRWAHRQTPNVGIAIFLPDGWCASCPCGGQCPVFRLRHGGTEAATGTEPAAVRLDDHATALARALVDGPVYPHVLHHEATILRLLCWLHQATSATATGNSPVRIRADLAQKVHRAAAIIERRHDSPPTIAELARLAAMNECDLKRLFKCIFGQSIAAYSRTRRLEAARDLLVHGARSVTDVALEVGFSNPSRFAKAFRDHFGQNPADFRRERIGAR